MLAILLAILTRLRPRESRTGCPAFLSKYIVIGGGAYALLNIRPEELPAVLLGGLFCPFNTHLRNHFTLRRTASCLTSL